MEAWSEYSFSFPLSLLMRNCQRISSSHCSMLEPGSGSPAQRHEPTSAWNGVMASIVVFGFHSCFLS